MTGRVRTATVVGVGLALALALAFLVAPRASSAPDGLEKVAEEQGFAAAAREHDLAGSPTADYGVAGVEHDGLGTGLAGAIGIGATFLIAGGALLLVRRAGSGAPRRA